MTILHIISSLTGGPARILTDLVYNSPKKYTIVVMILNRMPREDELVHTLEKKVSKIVYVDRKKKLGTNTFKKIDFIRKNYSPNIIVSYDFRSSVVGYLLKKSEKTHWFPCVNGLETSFNWWRALINRIIFKASTKVIVPSNAVKLKLIQYRIVNEKKILIISNGIKLDGFKKKKHIFYTDINLVCVANFYSKVKGQQYAVHALKLLPNNYKLTFIGEGRELENIEALTKKLNLEDRVTFLGKQDNKSLRMSLPDFDIQVAPSLSESFGISIIEGMAAGLPIVASNVGGIPEVINSTCGVLVAPENPTSLAEGILRIGEDQKVRKILSEKGISRVEKHYSVEKMARSYHQYFAEAFKCN